LKTANNAVIGQVFQFNHLNCIGQSHTFTFLIFLYTHTNSDVLLKFSVWPLFHFSLEAARHHNDCMIEPTFETTLYFRDF